MAAKKPKTDTQLVEQTLPGWKVLKKSQVDAASAKIAPAGTTPADAVSPGLAAQQIKFFGKAKMAKKKAPGVKHSHFVTVSPKSQPDTATVFHKVMLVKNGKVVAQQG